ncbi:dihydropyrimidine dehydrogenase [Haloferax mediterranei ATCC 33500]|nr:tRNA-dihydrouridine synthase [Haloferax mediterranei]AFK20167.1 dihydropyrimidine dehydrogenase (NADP+) [Haloferax mediterranei ATCC 33500]AHZ23541.1 dihydropyrimidine dehydrogenase [Haloferax mediterranei ATCC 33500]MDX5987080.1 tRNA-dihydrouridine synthase [Haloferax mediterranei ATCC 33500]QCQ76395.1 dihydropyrimidine dehydrogenase [Haloferax mediterranei ATCC 33500]
MFSPRVGAASLSGESDAAWARAAAPHVGAAFLGGIALDDPAREAARELVARGRSEFLPDDPLAFVTDQLATLDETDLFIGVNVRATEAEPIRQVAAICSDYGAGVEVNAHCRQDELCAAGCGETLLRDTDRLVEFVGAAANSGAPVGVKVRAEVDGVALRELAPTLADAGADWLHIDAMDSESVVADVVDAAPDLFVVANNGVRDRVTAHEYLQYGADAVSVGRPSDDPSVLHRVRTAVDDWFADDGVEGPTKYDDEVSL